MATDETSKSGRSTVAVSLGIVAGLATALAIGTLFRPLDATAETSEQPNQSADSPVQVADLSIGNCVRLDSQLPSGVTAVECTSPHGAEITNVVDHPGSGNYPGATELSRWASVECETSAGTYLEANILDTNLVETMLVPTEEAWASGDRTIACYIAAVSGDPLEVSVQGQGSEFPRDEVIIVARLKVGDCFVPSADAEPYKLNSNSLVMIVDCQSPFAGMVFGRDLLPAGPNDVFPGTEQLKAITGDRCSKKFKDHFGLEADGFNYHYFRPSEESWEANDRSIMCSILDENPIVGGFNAANYRLFFDLDPGTCFDLGPEEMFDTIRINDMVMPVDCSETHAGQMIGTGLMDADKSADLTDAATKALAEEHCEVAYSEFMGFLPFESSYNTFPFWYPSNDEWLAGDRRFACAFIGPDLPQNSLQGQK